MSARKFWSEWHNDWVRRSSVRGVDFAKRLIMRLGKHCEDVEPEIYIRGWLIERARTRRLRAELAEARNRCRREGFSAAVRELRRFVDTYPHEPASISLSQIEHLAERRWGPDWEVDG